MFLHLRMSLNQAKHPIPHPFNSGMDLSSPVVFMPIMAIVPLIVEEDEYLHEDSSFSVRDALKQVMMLMCAITDTHL